MATAIEQLPVGAPDETASRAADHLWMHFARQGRHPEVPVPVVTRGEGVAPPLICGQAEFDEMEQILRHTLTEAQKLV
ncbi:MAG: hypothetical protein JNM77_12970 [Pseudonocardia sp.]|nr:hypothetical protein [Pseudonocardia sp.]